MPFLILSQQLGSSFLFFFSFVVCLYLVFLYSAVLFFGVSFSLQRRIVSLVFTVETKKLPTKNAIGRTSVECMSIKWIRRKIKNFIDVENGIKSTRLGGRGESEAYATQFTNATRALQKKTNYSVVCVNSSESGMACIIIDAASSIDNRNISAEIIFFNKVYIYVVVGWFRRQIQRLYSTSQQIAKFNYEENNRKTR